MRIVIFVAMTPVAIIIIIVAVCVFLRWACKHATSVFAVSFQDRHHHHHHHYCSYPHHYHRHDHHQCFFGGLKLGTNIISNVITITITVCVVLRWA